MEDNLHNDNLEDFFRKSLGNYEDNPDDTTWGNIAPFIVPTGVSEVNSLQNKIQALSNQNVLLKSLLAAICVVLIAFQPFNSNNQQQKITLLGQQLVQQNQTIDALNNKIDSLYSSDNENIAANASTKKTTHLSNSAFSTSSESPNAPTIFKQDAYSLKEKGIASNNPSQKKSPRLSVSAFKNPTPSEQSKNFRAKTNTTDYQTPATEEKTPFSTNNNPQNQALKKSPHPSNLGFYNPMSGEQSKLQYPISNIQPLPFLLIEEKDLEMMALQRQNSNEWKKDIEEKEENKHLKIQLPNLKPIIENLTVIAFLQTGKTENHFKYEDSFIGEELAKINGKFKEDAKMLQYGLLVGYKVHPRVQIEGGIGSLKYSQNLDGIEIEGIYKNPDSDGSLTFNDQFYTSYSDNQIQFAINDVAQHFPSANIGDTLRVPIRLEQEISYISVPLSAKYNIGEKRLSFYIKGGGAVNFLIENELDISSSHTSFREQEMYSQKGLPPIYLTYQLETGLQYQVSKRIGLQIAPYFMGNLTQLTENLPVIAYPSTKGLRFGATYEF
ncbi:MAG: hypothetical protein R3E32_24375 [Chitinophagales bacterium]